jgi:hypothetical protein
MVIDVTDYVPLTDTEMAVIDAAMAEELVDDLGLLDDPDFAERYRAQVRARSQGLSSGAARGGYVVGAWSSSARPHPQES